MAFHEAFGPYFLNEDMSDLKIVCDQREFPVHKILLSAMSPVFKAMFESNYTEATSKTLQIAGTDGETLEKFLYFLYTDEVNPNEEFDCLRQLLHLADGYQVNSLDKIIDAIGNKIRDENAMEVLYTAFLINNEKLMEIARVYILKRAIIQKDLEIQKSPFWDDLLKKDRRRL